MSGEMMNFPDTAEEFMEQYKIVDSEEVYTNGAELVPIFRMKQWFEQHPEPYWIPVAEEPKESGKYLVTAVISFIPDHVGDPDTYEAVTTANYLADTRNPIKWWGNNVEKVLAWMPLPEPYTEPYKGVTE